MCTCTIFEMGVDWKKNQENSGIKISGRPVANASNICVKRHIIRIIVAQVAIAQFN